MKGRTLATLVVIIVAVTVGWWLAERSLAFVRVAEGWVYDVRMAALGERKPQSEEIAVVTITEETLDRFPYRSPVDRGFLSELLRELARKEVRAIGLDVLLDQPTEPGKDGALRETLQTLEVPIVVAWADESDGLARARAAFLRQYLQGLEVGTVDVVRDGDDETVRSIRLWRELDAGRIPSLSVALARRAGVDPEGGPVRHLAYRRGPDARTPPFPVYPAHAVALLPGEWLGGKIVLIGADLALSDRHRTPLSAGAEAGTDARLPGVMVHAHALSQLIEGRHSRRLVEWQIVAVLLVSAALGASIAASRAPAPARGGVALLALVAWWVGGFYLYAQLLVLLPVVVPTLGFVSAGGIAQAYFLARERGQRRFLHHAFGRYLAPAVVERLVADPAALRLSGEQRELTLLFTDIEGFTPLTERLAPGELMALLDAYLDRASAIVLAHGGTIDKLVGDALHVMFNAPDDQPGHAEAAVRCALALDDFSRAFIDEQRAGGIAFGRTRIGINTGRATVGNFGGDLRFDYTAHGPAVNLAARLEAANKHLGTRICVSGETKRRCERLLFRPVGRVSLVGVAAPVDVFEPLPRARADRAALARYVEAYSLMAKGDPGAHAAFVDLAREWPDDGLVARHAERLEAGQSGDLMVLEAK